MNRYAVFYADMEMFSQAHRGEMHKEGDAALPMSEFRRCYRFVGVHEAESFEDLFALLNGGKPGIPNPLGDPHLQELVIRDTPGRTSMSVGDVAVDLETGEKRICAPIGFSELDLV